MVNEDKGAQKEGLIKDDPGLIEDLEESKKEESTKVDPGLTKEKNLTEGIVQKEKNVGRGTSGLQKEFEQLQGLINQKLQSLEQKEANLEEKRKDLELKTANLEEKRKALDQKVKDIVDIMGK